MVWSEAELKAMARQRYERGRFSVAFARALMVSPLVGLAIVLNHEPFQALAVGLALFVAVTLMGWRGVGWERAILPGLLAGGIAGGLALVADHLDTCCVGVESRMCLAMCFAGGVIAGALISVWALRSADPERGARRRNMLLGAGVVAALTASMGCAVGGIAGLVGMFLGLLLLTTPALALTYRRA